MPSVFPSGMTDWLHLPLSLYVDSYNANNVYIKAGQYRWHTDAKGHAIPLDVEFFRDIFTNGTRAGMKMFEQDFLCSYNTGSNLTKQDVSSGMIWFDAMDTAAQEFNTTLQFCMMNAVHTLASTLVHQATNGRATRDNHPGTNKDERANPTNAGNGLVLGLSSLMHFAVGIWPSRDNVWTNGSVTSHGGPEYMPETQTLMAVLSGGPYGPGDAVANRSLLMRACRADGVMLRPDKPVTIMDRALTAVGFGQTRGPITPLNVWSTHSNVGGDGYRYGYVLGLNLLGNQTLAILPSDIDPPPPSTIEPAATVVDGGDIASNKGRYLVYDYWRGPSAPGNLAVMEASRPFRVPTPPLDPNPAVITSTYHILAPILSSNWTLLGEPAKIIAASVRRITSLESRNAGLVACLLGAPGETAIMAVHDGQKVREIECTFGSSSSEATGANSAGGGNNGLQDDVDVTLCLQCHADTGCSCAKNSNCTVPDRFQGGGMNF